VSARIQLLPENVANQIAAGEVIERPASVLKELLENALDAGAKQIDVRTRGGGRSLVEVTDDGCGMNRDDALLCLERHATSKLRVTEDLHHLSSYGFRGEALPSIASVSKFALRTREPGALAGNEVIVQGGKLVAVREAGLAPGTQVEVRSLFYNLPARRKFLRTERTELAHLQHTLLLAALSRPDVGFQMIHDDEPPVRWPAQQDLGRRIAAVFGAPWFRDLVPVAGADGDLRLSGFIGKPGISRATRQEQFLFVNHRPVESRTLHFALQEGYHNALMRGRYPVTVLFLTLDPEGVDVNIHPAKREVRFHDDARVRFFLKQAIQQALQGFDAAPVSVPVGRVREEPPVYGVRTSTPAPEPAVQLETNFLPPEIPRPAAPPPVRAEAAPRPAFVPAVPAPAPGRAPFQAAPVAEGAEPGNRLGLRLLGIVAHLYIVAESPEGLVLIDQHAAHERVMFERVLDRMRRREVESQRLLLPATVELPPREADFLTAQLDSLQAIGVGISAFGARAFLVDSLPPMIAHHDVPELIRTLVADLQEEGGETRKERRLSEEVVAKKACRLAVKANDRLSTAEGERLIADLLACALPYTCPHGRPTMIQITRGELEKKFGRVGTR
jgi:DNA mismatch repair protein MutL